MDEQLNLAPFGYMVIDSKNCIVEMNAAMCELIGTIKMPVHVHNLLTAASRVYFQTYFMPSIKLHGKVNEMFLAFKNVEGPIPVLMNEWTFRVCPDPYGRTERIRERITASQA